MTYKRHFKCPICDAPIINKIINDDPMIFKSFEPPTCSNCGRKYMITVFPDFSYEIKDIEE